MRWANGRGFTQEIVTWPSPEEWAWRISLAEVNNDGPFSELAGVDRALAVASGKGMDLRIDGVSVTVEKFGSITFPGESAVVAELIDGPVRDLNLMVRRDSDWG